MEHPFFSSIVYPWRLRLANELYNALLTATNGRMFLVDKLVKTAGVDPGAIVWTGPLLQIWMNILDVATTSRRLEALLDCVLEEPTLLAIHAKVQEVKAVESMPIAVDVFAGSVLRGEKPFLNRSKLRPALRKMFERLDSAPSILLVRGAPESGKTHTVELLKALRDENHNEQDRVVYLFESNAARVDKAIRHLRTAIAPTPAEHPFPPGNTSAPAADDQLALELMTLAAGTGKRWWIVLDDISAGADGKPRMDPGVLTFFHQFALQMLDPQFAKWFRLVLLGYPAGVGMPPSKLRKSLLAVDTTAPLLVEDVRSFVRDFHDLREMKYTQTDLDQEATEAFEEAKRRVAEDVARLAEAAGPGAAAGAAPPEPALSMGRAVEDTLTEWVEEKS